MRTGHGLDERAPLGRRALAIIQAVQIDPADGQRPAGRQTNAAGTRHRAQRGRGTQGFCQIEVRAERERHGAAEILHAPLGERHVGQRCPGRVPHKSRRLVQPIARLQRAPELRQRSPRGDAVRGRVPECGQPRAHVNADNDGAPRGEPLRDGIGASAPAAIPGQQQHEVV